MPSLNLMEELDYYNTWWCEIAELLKFVIFNHNQKTNGVNNQFESLISSLSTMINLSI